MRSQNTVTKVSFIIPIFPLILAAAFAIGCTRARLPGSESQAQTANFWELRLLVECESPDNCIAGHGFAITGEGKYRIGPAPNGDVRFGVVDSESMEQFAALFTLISERQTQSCSQHAMDTSSQIVTYSVGARRTELLRVKTGMLCSNFLDAEVAMQLYQLVLRIAESKYDLPFPDGGCDQAITSLESLYHAVRKCSADSDCYYAYGSMTPIPRDMFALIATQECSPVKPLLVGNLALMEKNSAKLRTKRQYADDACRNRLINTSCSSAAQFLSSQPGPSCVEGICRINPIGIGR